VSAARRIPFLGLTGAIAAGKSEVLSIFERLGAATLSADAVVHELLGGERVRDLLVERWGPDVGAGDGVDRARVGNIVFGDSAELAWLERTLHPLVGERIAAWREGLDPDTPLAVVEVPLLFETGMEEAFDATVCVVAPDALRVERAGARGTEELDGRVARQLPQAEKMARATFVVHNGDGLTELEQAVGALFDDVIASAEAPE
jgi:dephospho-CoA kinase